MVTVRPGTPVLLLVDGPEAGGSTDVRVERAHVLDRLRIRLAADRLDGELAAGRSPDRDRLRAQRARRLISTRERSRLAGFWRDLLRRATAPPRLGDRRVTLARATVNAARDEIIALIEALGDGSPVTARGVAGANLLLTRGSSPVYSPSRGDLRAAIRTVLDRLPVGPDPIG